MLTRFVFFCGIYTIGAWRFGDEVIIHCYVHVKGVDIDGRECSLDRPKHIYVSRGQDMFIIVEDIGI